MNPVYFSVAASKDLQEIFEYIAQDNRSAAEQLLEDIEAGCSRLRTNPKQGIARDDLWEGIRLIVVRRNYLVFYRIGDQAIDIVRIVHGKRDYGKLFPQ